MSVLETSTPSFSDVVKYESEPKLGLCRDGGVLVNLDATAPVTWPVGTVLGKITASGKWTICKAAASDGSQTPAGVLLADGLGISRQLYISAGAEVRGLVLIRGRAVLSANDLTFGAGTTLAAVTTAFKALNITIETTV